MFRSLFIRASLTGLLLASCVASIAAASEVPDVSNIGFVLYTKSYAPGTLNAKWLYANKYSGPGIATGGPKEGFAGHYHVRYFFDSGEFSEEYDLIIERTGDAYRVSWISNGKISAVGVGMEVDNGLAVGCRLAQSRGLTVTRARSLKRCRLTIAPSAAWRLNHQTKAWVPAALMPSIGWRQRNPCGDLPSCISKWPPQIEGFAFDILSPIHLVTCRARCTIRV